MTERVTVKGAVREAAYDKSLTYAVRGVKWDNRKRSMI